MKKEDHEQQPSERERLEARVLAMLLGECDAEEQTTVEALLAKSPDLQAYRESAECRLGLLKEASQGKAALESEPLQLDPERHRELEKLLTGVSKVEETDKVTPFEPVIEPSETNDGRKWSRFLSFGGLAAVVTGAAAAVVAGIVIIAQSNVETDSDEKVALADESQTVPVFQPKEPSQRITLKEREIGSRKRATTPPKQPERSLRGEELQLVQKVSEIEMPDLEMIAEAETLAKREELAALEPILADEVAQTSGAILDKRLAKDIDAFNGAFDSDLAKADRQADLDDAPAPFETKSADSNLALVDRVEFNRRNVGAAGFSSGGGALRSSDENDKVLARDSSSTLSLRSKTVDLAPHPAKPSATPPPPPSAPNNEPESLQSFFLAHPEPPVIPLAPHLEEKPASEPSPPPIGIESSAAFNKRQNLASNGKGKSPKALKEDSLSSASTKESLDNKDALTASNQNMPLTTLPSVTSSQEGVSRGQTAPFPSPQPQSAPLPSAYSPFITINDAGNRSPRLRPMLEELRADIELTAGPLHMLKLIATGPIKLLYVKSELDGKTAQTFRDLEKGDELELPFRKTVEGGASSIENLKLEMNGKQFGFQLTGPRKFHWPPRSVRK